MLELYQSENCPIVRKSAKSFQNSVSLISPITHDFPGTKAGKRRINELSRNYGNSVVRTRSRISSIPLEAKHCTRAMTS